MLDDLAAGERLVGYLRARFGRFGRGLRRERLHLEAAHIGGRVLRVSAVCGGVRHGGGRRRGGGFGVRRRAAGAQQEGEGGEDGKSGTQWLRFIFLTSQFIMSGYSTPRRAACARPFQSKGAAEIPFYCMKNGMPRGIPFQIRFTASAGAGGGAWPGSGACCGCARSSGRYRGRSR